MAKTIASSQEGKKAAARGALDFVQSGMILGLGSGTTSEWFIRYLSESPLKKNIKAIASSKQSYLLAQQLEIPLIDPDAINHIDLTVDGADEIDSKKQMIKGGGGALLREKIMAFSSDEMIVIVDSSKQVEYLGRYSLPIEISSFAYQATLHKIFELGYQGSMRQKSEKLYISDNGNLIFDAALKYPCDNPKKIDDELKNIPGVIETGFFLGIAGRVIIGFENGRNEIIP